MLANTSTNIWLRLLIAVFVIAFVVIVGGTAWVTLQARKTILPTRKKYSFA